MRLDTTSEAAASGFRHEALLYAGEDDFVRKLVPFVDEGLDAGEAVLVVVSEQKDVRLRAELGDRAAGVRFADLEEVGRNPAWIIPLWRDFLSENGHAGVRGIGEPVYPERDPDAVAECQRHESLLNVAFEVESDPKWTLLCPYDVEALPHEVVDEALRSHPHVHEQPEPNPRYRGRERCAEPLESALSEPPADAFRISVRREDLRTLRRALARYLANAGVDTTVARDLVLAVHELAANSVRHGGGVGSVRAWRDASAVVAEVRDRGVIQDPLAGRVRPDPQEAAGSRGLWLVSQLSDLVQIRALDGHGVVRVRKDLSRA